VATGVIDIGSGVQSYSTNDIGNNSYALDGKSLSLADAGAVYTIDELDSDDAEIIDDNEGRTDNSSGDSGLSDSISADEDYELAIQAIGSQTHAGTDSATSYSDDLEDSGSGGSDWQFCNCAFRDSAFFSCVSRVSWLTLSRCLTRDRGEAVSTRTMRRSG
jgi:hypothetical protein